MKALRYYILIIVLSALPLVSIFSTPFLPHTHDGAVHLPRMAAYYKAFMDGQILPRWAGDLNYGYGMPLFNFIYQTPYLVAVPFIRMGVSLVLTFKILLAISYISAGLCMYLFAKKLFRDERTAVIVTLFYQFAPFRLIEMLVRGSLGEMYTYVFLPLVLYGLTCLFEKITPKAIAITALGTSLLVISHNSISLVFFGVIVLFVLFYAKHPKNFLWAGVAIALGLTASSFYWLPAILEHKYTHGDLYMRELFRQHFPPLYQFFVPNFLNSKSLQTMGISVQLGLFHTISLLLAGVVILTKRKVSELTKKTLLFSLVLTGMAFFFMIPTLSVYLWEKLSFLRQFQFPWRLLSLTSFSTAITAVSFLALNILRRNVPYVLLLVLTIGSTFFYWQPPLGFDRVPNERIYWDYPLNTTFFGETDVIWSAGPAKSYPSSLVEVIEGTAQIENIFKKSTLHMYQISASGPVRVVDNTQYFPGWRVYVDGKKTPVEFQDQNWRGLITFQVPSGVHAVRVAFEKSPVQFISEYLSLGSLLLFIPGVMIVIKKRKV